MYHHKKLLSGIAFFTAVATLTPNVVYAQNNSRKGDLAERVASPRLQTNSSDMKHARSIEMGVGRSIVVDLPRDAKEVFVANPAVANAVVRSARKLFIIGVATGSTTIIALDGEGQQIAAMEMQIGREPGLMQKTLKLALPHADIKAVSVGDTIVLTGTVDNVLEAQKVVDIAKGFVGTTAIGGGRVEGKVINSLSIRGKDQVMLKVTVAEVKRTAIKQLGVNLAGSWQPLKPSGRRNLSTSTPFVGSLRAPTSAIGAAISTGNLFADIDIQMLERHGLIKTLAEPTLTAISGETAKFVAGGEIPVPKSEEAPSQSVTTFGIINTPGKVSYEYKPFGVMLNFTPVVLSEGRISLSIGTEVTEIDNEYGATNATTTIPAFRTRKVFTTIELPSGGSLMTAGLLQQISRQSLNGLPGLINLPVIGSLFRSRDYFREETELMVIVTPYIAKPSAPNNLAKPTDGLIDASDPSALLMGRLNRVYGAAGAAPVNGYRGQAGFIHE
jgi:pilus assembly protein CpaC